MRLALVLVVVGACGGERGSVLADGGSGDAAVDSDAVSLASGAAVPLDPERLGAAFGDQSRVALASAGEYVLAVWEDSVRGVVAGRIDRDGAPLDGVGVTVDGPVTQEPAVASNGVDFLAVWATRSGVDTDIYARRIDAGGAALEPQVAWLDGEWLVTWTRFEPGRGQHLMLARLDASGATQAPPTPVVSSPIFVHAIAAVGAGALVAWTDGYEVQAVRITAGAVGDEVPLVPGVAIRGLAMTSAGDRYLAAVVTSVDGICRVLVIEVPLAGPVTPRTASIGECDDLRVPAPAIAASGDATIVSWIAQGIEVARMVGDDVTARTSLTSAGSKPPSLQSLAIVDGRAVVAYAQRDDLLQATDVFAVGLGDATAPPAADRYRVLGIGPAQQILPAIAVGAAGQLAAWCDSSGDGLTRWDLRATHIDATGVVGAPTAIAQGRGTDCGPAVAAGDDGYLVAWTGDQRSVQVIRLGRAGRPIGLASTLDVGTTVPSAGWPEPRVAHDRHGYLVVWRASGTSPSSLAAARISPDGAIRVLPTIETGAGCVRHALTDGTTASLLLVDCEGPGVSPRTRAVQIGADGVVSSIDLDGAKDAIATRDAIGHLVVAVYGDGEVYRQRLGPERQRIARALPHTTWGLAVDRGRPVLMWTGFDEITTVAAIGADALGPAVVVSPLPTVAARVAAAPGLPLLVAFHHFDGERLTVWARWVDPLR